MKLRTCILAALTLSACYGDVCVEFFDGKCPSEGGAAGTAGTGGGGNNQGGGGDGGIGGSGGSGGNAGGGGNSGGGGEGGMTPTQCIPAAGVTIGADCGVFVQSGADGNGQQATPTANLQTAVTAASANGSRFRNVYICGSDSLAQTASLVVNNGVNIYGGLNCGTWDYNEVNVPTIQGPADVPAVLVQNGSSTLQGLTVSAPNAGALGASSIGIIVDGSADLSLVSASVTSGTGRPGVAGAQFATMAPAGDPGDNGLAGCTGTVGLAGGGGGEKDNCPGSTPSNGGPGGSGTSGNTGGNGNPGDDGGGSFGAGQTVGCGGGGSPTEVAANGPDATMETALGNLTINGYSQATPGAGAVGVGGKGGGGGGGGKECSVGTDFVGPSGGGGGSGGCGGAGGPSGGGGGASFGVVLLAGAELSLSNSTIAAGIGGNGGAGAQGQEGGNGGPGGIQGFPAMGSSNPNGSTACAGGVGGKGGDGGDGAGGVGGPVAAVVAAAPGQVTQPGTNTLSAGTPGSGGPGAGAAPMGATAQSCMGVMLLENGIGTCE